MWKCPEWPGVAQRLPAAIDQSQRILDIWLESADIESKETPR